MRIETAELYAPLHEELIGLLSGLGPEDWIKPTVCRGWAVRDVAAHLLDVDLRRLSFNRDEADAPAVEGELIGYLNRLNEEWVTAARRFSPRVLLDLLRGSGPQVAAHVMALDPSGRARFSVGWAGEEVSENWFDVARDYTERWHHQQQIRDAVGAPALYSRRYLRPVLETFLLVLPHAYRSVAAGHGTVVEVRIDGEAGGVWRVERGPTGWRLMEGEAGAADASVELDQDTAWRHFTRGLSAGRIRATGAEELTEPFLGALAIMAAQRSARQKPRGKAEALAPQLDYGST